jgi:malonyl CoA-acyl carrier protein transacylase
MTRIQLFPGQGSQKIGMGAGLFERFPEQAVAANAELGYSIAELCLSYPRSS